MRRQEKTYLFVDIVIKHMYTTAKSYVNYSIANKNDDEENTHTVAFEGIALHLNRFQCLSHSEMDICDRE